LNTSLLISLFFATLASEDLTCITGGILFSQNRGSFWEIYLVISLGIFLGDLGLYGLGILSRNGLLRFNKIQKLIQRWETTDTIQKIKYHSNFAIFLSRFFPGTRLPIYLLSGFLKIPFLSFFFISFIAVSIWTLIVVYLSSILHEKILNTFQSLNPILSVSISILSFYLLIRGLSWLGSKEKRNQFWIGIQKIPRLEFWPSFIFYLPLVPYLIYLSIRFRGIRYITTVNPAIIASGIAGESKSEILRLLPEEQIAKWILINPEEIHLDKKIKDFILKKKVKFPFVLKPDKGERGFAVQKVHSIDEVLRIVKRNNFEWILQEFIPGSEIGLFYIRNPKDSQGRIFSITKKTFPKITGDGFSTVKTLIQSHPRFKFQSNTHFRNNQNRLSEIVKANESISIGEIGNHVLGCLFTDGSDLITKELSLKINKIMAKTEGIYFGRFDIRFTSDIDLKLGKKFKIIELNGATSESTNLYDPNFKIWESYRILFRQWKELYEIGHENYLEGAPLFPYLRLIEIIKNHLTYKKSFSKAEKSMDSFS